MALTLLGKLTDPRYLPYHDAGNERTFWDAAWPHYLHGLTPSELVGFIAKLNLGVRPTLHGGTAANILKLSSHALTAGRPVIVGWHQRDPVPAHAALVVGVEGRRVDRTFVPQALLLIDPAGCEPGLAGFNARIDWHSDQSVRYVSPTNTRRIALEVAVSIRLSV